MNITFYEPEFAYDGNLTAMVASDHFNLTLQHLVYNKVVVATTSTTTQVAPTPKPPRTSAITFRPPIRLPVIPHHHHGPRWGPYFEDGDKEENVTARVGTTVRLDCKIGMLQDKMVSLLLPPHHAKLRTVRGSGSFEVFCILDKTTAIISNNRPVTGFLTFLSLGPLLSFLRWFHTIINLGFALGSKNKKK